jgi:hypothetical protein
MAERQVAVLGDSRAASRSMRRIGRGGFVEPHLLDAKGHCGSLAEQEAE